MSRSSSLVPVRSEATEVPSLPKGNDKAVAEKLQSLITDATDGRMRIVILGAFIERIKAELAHGHFNAWISAHCPDVTRNAVYQWRKICAGILNDSGITGHKLRSLERPLYEVLEIPFDDLSESEQEIVSKIRDAASKTTSKDLQRRPKKEPKVLSPVESVNAKNLEAYKRWALMIGEMDLALNGDSLNRAIHHDPAFSNRIEEVRLRLGDTLKEVLRAHKRETSIR